MQVLSVVTWGEPPTFSGLYTCQDTDSIPNVLYS